jgi:hypothetical protein
MSLDDNIDTGWWIDCLSYGLVSKRDYHKLDVIHPFLCPECEFQWQIDLDSKTPVYYPPNTLLGAGKETAICPACVKNNRE